MQNLEGAELGNCPQGIRCGKVILFREQVFVMEATWEYFKMVNFLSSPKPKEVLYFYFENLWASWK